MAKTLAVPKAFKQQRCAVTLGAPPASDSAPPGPGRPPLCVTTLAREEDQGQATNHPRLVHVWDTARLSPTRPPVTWAVTLVSGSERPPPTQELPVCYGFCCDWTRGIRL